MPTLKHLAANAMVRDKVKYFEEKASSSTKQPPIIVLDKKPVSFEQMRD